MQKERKRISVWIKISVVIVWAFLFIVLLQRDYFLPNVDTWEQETMQQAEEEEYQSIYFREDKIGFVRSRFSENNNKSWTLLQEAYMRLNVAGSVQDIHLKLEGHILENHLLQTFAFTFSSPFYQMEASGKVEGSRVTYSLDTGTNIINDSVIFQTPPMLATSRRGYLLRQGMAKGDKIRVPWFDPFSLTGKHSVIEYHGKQSLQLGGRVDKLHHFTESFSGVRINSWLNDSGIMVKEESPAGFVFIKEPKFKALKGTIPDIEILSTVAVQPEAAMPTDLHNRQSLQYLLTIPPDIDLDLTGDRQQFDNQTLSLSLEKIPDHTTLASCEDAQKNLQPSPYIQSDHKDIKALATELTSSTSNKVEQVNRIFSWVNTNLEKRPVLGLPDALTTLKNRQGDCNEHAALFSALAKAAEIPSRIVAGVTYHKEAFYYHAWNEVCLGSQWISLDTTTNQFPADLSHLRLIIGETREQVKIGGLLGKLTIQPLGTYDNTPTSDEHSNSQARKSH